MRAVRCKLGPDLCLAGTLTKEVTTVLDGMCLAVRIRMAYSVRSRDVLVDCRMLHTA